MPTFNLAALRPAFDRLSVAGKLLSVSAAAVVLLLVAGFSIVIFQAHAVVERISAEQAFADARANARLVEGDVAEVASGAQAAAVAVSNLYDANASRADVVRTLKTYLNITPLEFGVWHIAQPDAIGLDADNRKGPGSSALGRFAPWWLRPGGKVILDPVDVEVDYEQEYYKKAYQQGKPAMVEPYAYPVYGVNYTMTSLVYPVYQRGRIVGVAGMDMTLDEITARLAKVRPFGVGRLLLVSQAGTWLGHPDAAKQMKPYEDAGKDVVQKVLSSGQPASFRLRAPNGTDMIRFVQPVELSRTGVRWALISEVPAAAISAPATDLGWKLVLFGAVVIAGLLGALLLAVRRIVGAPVHALADTVDRLAQGENLPIPALDREDEIGKLARAADVFRQAAADRAAADARSAEELARVTASIGTGLAALRDGDLTAVITEAYPPAYAALKDNYNETVAVLRTLIASVADTAQGIRTGAMEIAAASDDLARRTESNAASLEQTSAALTQIDGRLRASASAADATVSRADEAIAVVDAGKTLALRAVEAMERVSDSARGIDSVIEALDKIAFQTRVLAMNAAVEAGRAGEAGRGFAVVADLVSALAMRSEQEAARAHEQLDAAQTEVQSAVERVEQVDGAFERVLREVRGVHDLVGGMATDNRTQSSAVTEISGAIAAMDHATQQNAAMVEQASAAARTLHHESETLAARAAAFKTGQRPGAGNGRATDVSPERVLH